MKNKVTLSCSSCRRLRFPTFRYFALLALLLSCITPAIFAANGDTAGRSVSAASAATVVTPRQLDRIPLLFEENRGQAEPSARFISRGPGYALTFTRTGTTLRLSSGSGDQARHAALETRLLDANRGVHVEGIDPLSTRVSYFLGKDASRWIRNIPSFGKVRYRDIYPAIDLVYYGSGNELEYDFVVKPGANPSSIRMAFDGAMSVQTTSSGDLRITTSGGEVLMRKPVVYQTIGNSRHAVDGGFVVKGKRVTFDIAAYDHSRPLVIDPVLSYMTYFGLGNESVDGIVATETGLYFVGETLSPNLPLPGTNPSPVPQGLKSTCGTSTPCDNSDLMIGELSNDGTTLQWLVYFGGSGNEHAPRGSTPVLDQEYGILYFVGTTTSSDFPTSENAYIGTCPGCQSGAPNGFVAGIDSDGSQLSYSTFLGGSAGSKPTQVRLFRNTLIIAGGTSSPDLIPANVNSPERALTGSSDGFVLTLAPSNSPSSQLTFASYIGGSASDIVTGLEIDASGNIYLTGNTTSPDFPTENPLQKAFEVGLFTTGSGDSSWYSSSKYSTGLDNPNVTCLKKDPYSYTLYVCTAGGGSLYRSNDGGYSYQQAGDGLNNAQLDNFAVDNNIGSLFAVVRGQGIYRAASSYYSTPQWTLSSNGIALPFNVTHIAVEPFVGNILLAMGGNWTVNNATQPGGLYRSTDGGNTWSPVQVAGAPTGNLTFVGWSPDLAGVVYASLAPGNDGQSPGGLYVSNDYGANWTQVNNDATIVKFHLGSRDAGTLLPAVFAFTNSNTIEVSHDGGMTFDAHPLPATPTATLLQHGTNGYVLSIGTNRAGVYQSADEGVTWTAITGMEGQHVTALQPVFYDTYDYMPGSLMAGTRNDGQVWFAYVTTANGTIQLPFSTYFGGSGGDSSSGIAIDSAGNAYIGGVTNSTDFPLTEDTSPNSSATAFIAKFPYNSDPETGTVSFSKPVFSEYAGPGDNDRVYGVYTDSLGNTYLAGSTDEVHAGDVSGLYTGLESDNTAGRKGFAVKVDNRGNLQFAAIVGGNTYDEANAVSVDSNQNVYIAGTTSSPDLPVTAEVLQHDLNLTDNSKGTNAFFAKVRFTGDRTNLQAQLDYSNTSAPPGGVITANLTVTNSGPVTATSVTVQYTIPSNATVNTSSVPSDCTLSPAAPATPTSLNCTISSLAVGQWTHSFTLTAGTTEGSADSSLSVSASNAATSSVTVPISVNSTTSITTAVDMPSVFTTGTFDNVSVVVSNQSASVDAKNYTLNVTVDPRLVISSVNTSGCDWTNGTQLITCPASTLAADTTFTLTFTVIPTGSGQVNVNATGSTSTPTTSGSTLSAVGYALISTPSFNTGSNQGYEYWLAMPPNTGNGHKSLRLVITTTKSASFAYVVITSPSDPGHPEETTIYSGNQAEIDLPSSWEVQGNDTVSNRSIHVTSSAPIVVNGFNYTPTSTDGYMGMPVNLLGTDYYALTYPTGGSGITVVGTSDETAVTITLPASAGSRQGGTPYTVNLNAGDEYYIESDSADLSGTHITSTQPVAVFGSNQCAVVTTPGTEPPATPCSYLVEQLPPTNLWGRNFATLGNLGRSDTVLLGFAASNATIFGPDGSEQQTLQANTPVMQPGQFASFSSSEPMFLMQFTTSNSGHGDVGGATMSVVPPREHWSKNYSIVAPDQPPLQNFVDLVVPEGAAPNVTVNSEPLSNYASYPSEQELQFETYHVPLDSYTVLNISSPTNVLPIVGGSGGVVLFAYPGGWDSSSSLSFATLSLAVDHSTLTVGNQECLTATLSQEPVGNPREGSTSSPVGMPDVPVNFAVTGTNNQNKSVVTDSNGNAQFCYSSNYGGTDTAIATADALSSNAETVTWTPVADLSVSVMPYSGDTPLSTAGSVAVNGPLSFHVTVTNNGPSPADGFTLNQSTAFGGSGSVLSISAPPNFSCNFPTSDNCTGSLDPNASATITVAVSPTAIGTVTHTASVSGGPLDSNTENNSASAQVSVVAGADLQLSVTGPASGQGIYGQQYSYSATITNNSATESSEWSLSEQLSTKLQFVSGTSTVATCGAEGQSVSCSSTSALPPGGTATVTFQVNALATGAVIHSLVVYGSQPDPNLANNAASFLVKLLPSATAVDSYYAVDRDASRLRIFRAADDVESPTDLPAAGAASTGAVISPNGRLAYVGNINSRYVSVIDLVNRREIYRIRDVRTGLPILTEDGSKLILPDLLTNKVFVYDAITFALLNTIDTSSLISGYTFGDGVSTGNDVFIALQESGGSLLDIDLSSNNFYLVSLPTDGSSGQNHSIALTPDHKFLVVTRTDGTFIVHLDTVGIESTPVIDQVTDSEDMIGVGVAVTPMENNPSGTYAYVLGEDSVSKIDLNPKSSTYATVVARQTLNFSPPSNTSDIAITHDGSELIIAARRGQMLKVATKDLSVATLPGINARVRQVGSAYVETVQPASAPVTVDGASPATFTAGPSQTFTVTGSGFTSDTRVRIGRSDPLPVTFNSSTQLTATLPADAPIVSNADLTVTVPNDGNLATADISAILPKAITINPPAGFEPSQQFAVNSMVQNTASIFWKSRLATVPTGPITEDFRVTPDGHAYFTSYGLPGISATNLNNGAVTNLSLPGEVGQAVGVLYRPDPTDSTGGRHVFYAVSSFDDGVQHTPDDALYVIDAEPTSTTYMQVLRTIRAQTNDSTKREAAIAATSDGRYVYAVNLGSSPSLLIFDVKNGIGGNIPLADLSSTSNLNYYQGFIQVSPDNKYLLLLNSNNTLSIYDISTNPLAPAYLVGLDGNGPIVDGSKSSPGPTLSGTSSNETTLPFQFDHFDIVGSKLFALDASHEQVVLKVFNWNPNGEDLSLINTVPVTSSLPNLLSGGMAVSSDGTRVYLSGESDDTVTIVDPNAAADSDPILARFATGLVPTNVAILSDSAPTANLVVSMDSPSSATAGIAVQYTVHVQNLGPSYATGTTLTDTFPTATTVVSSTTSLGSCTSTSGTVTCNFGDLAPNAIANVTLTLRPLVAGTFVNTATVNSALTDPTPTDNTVSNTLTVGGCSAPSGFTKTWIGGDSADPTAWTVDDNWFPAGVPQASDSVYICSEAGTQPVLSSDTTVKGLEIDTGTTVGDNAPDRAQSDPGTGKGGLMLNAQLTATGNVNAGRITGNGALILSGTGTTFQGNVTTLQISGSVSLSGPGTTTGTVTVNNAGSLDLGGQSLDSGAAFSTASGGSVSMTHTADQLTAPSFVFSGTGTFSAGTINVNGNFVANANGAFNATGTNLVKLNGPSSSVQLSGTGLQFNDLQVSTPALSLGSNISVGGTLTITPPTNAVSLSGIEGSHPTLTSNNVNINGLDDNGLPLVINGNIVAFTNVTFDGFTASATPLSINNPGATFNLSNLVFTTQVSSGSYIAATDTNPGNGVPLVINVTNSIIPAGSPTVSTSGGATINWPLNPIPALAAATFGSAAGGAQVIATGANFIPGTQVQWDGVSVATTYTSAGEVHGIVPTNLVWAGSHTIQVFNPAPGGGTSTNHVSVSVQTGSYSLSTLLPSSTSAGSAGFTLVVSGSAFKPGMTVLFNGQPKNTAYYSSTELHADISAADVARPGTANVTVQGPSGLSNALSFVIKPVKVDPPSVSSFSPANASAGASSLMVTVNGANFTANSVVQANGANRSTTFVSATQLQATLVASDLAAGGTLKLTVVDSQTGQSSAVDYSVADFAAQADSAPITITHTQSASTNITITPKGGSFDNSISLACSGLPAGVGCTFSPATVTPGTTNASVKLTVGFTQSAQNRTSFTPIYATLGFGCFGILLAGTTRKRWLKLAIGLAAVGLIVLGMSGCGGGNMMSSTAPPAPTTSSFTVTVTATSGSAQHTSSFTLNVQQ